jgi:hypothetical protein
MALARTHRRERGGTHYSSSQQPSPLAVPRPRPLQLPVEGLPRLGRRSLLRVAPFGDRLVIADDTAVETFAILREGGRAVARRVARATLPGTVRDLLVAPDGATFALTQYGTQDVSIVRVDADQATQIRVLKARPTAAVATRRHLVFAVPGDDLTPPQLLALRSRDGSIVWREPLASARVRLRAGRDEELLIGERGGGQLRWVDVSRRADRCRPQADRPRPSEPGSDTQDDSGNPCCCPPGRRPEAVDHSQHDQPPPSRDPDDACIPGSDGDPDGCIVTYVENAVVVSINLCLPNDPPCTARLDWPIAAIARTPRTVIASARGGKRVAILDGRTLEHLYEHHAQARSVTAFAARHADVVFLHGDDGALTLLDPTPLLPEVAFDITSAVSSAVHQGQSAAVEYNGSGEQIGTRTVLIVPVLEPGQSFTATGTTKDFSNYYQIAEILEKANDFYEEATYHKPPQNYGMHLQFRWFGADTPELYTGKPIRLPKSFKDYWGPAWDPGAISSTVPIPGSGLMFSFSGDEILRLRAIPQPSDTYGAEFFEIRFPAASYRTRIPNGLSTLSFGPAAPLRTLSIEGTDRSGNMFSIPVNTSVLSNTTQVDLVRSALESGTTQQEALADVIEEMLASAPGTAGLFERPSVIWQDDGEQAGMLHISLSFAAGGGGSAPVVTSFNMDGMLTELGPGSERGSFNMPGDVGALKRYLTRILADASVRHPEFGSDLSRSYFDFTVRPPTVETDGGEMTIRINLSTSHGRSFLPEHLATIELKSQTGLDKIGMDNPQSIDGADTAYSGGGGPMFKDDKDRPFFSEIFTAMIDATIEAWGGNEAAAIDAFNRYFNCVGLENSPFECGALLAHNIVVTPVYPAGLFGTSMEPDVKELRANASIVSMTDLEAEQRTKPVHPIGASRRKLVTWIAPESLDEPDRGEKSASTLAHELGHGLLWLPDLYSGGAYRTQVQYVGDHCIMGASRSFAHFCAYNKRIKGWLDDDAILLIDRPSEDETIDREVVLIQLEQWDPELSEDARAVLAHSLLPGMQQGTPVVAAVFLRLGGDGRQFNIIELRGRGERFSRGIDPARVLITNAVDPEDDTRYAENELEGAGTTAGVLERYRRKVHLISAGLRAPGDTFDFALEPVFAEVGLQVTVLEWAAGSTGSVSFAIARLSVHWEHGPAIDLGFLDGIPDWQSPDIAVVKPEEIGEDGSFTFPEDHDPETLETFRLPSSPNEKPLHHKIAVRPWNFGNWEALNVQVELVLRLPKGAGDWTRGDVIGSKFASSILPSKNEIVEFDWPVTSEFDTHVCFRAQIGDRDVPRNDQGIALASDDTNAHNDWAQQNVFIYTAPADSPPEPVEFTFQVNNSGSYIEEVRLVPRGLGPGARLTVTPAQLQIAPKSRGLFRVHVELEERLLHARCGKDITFLLEAWRLDDHAEERWGAAKYVIKPRKRTQTILQGWVKHDQLRLWGHVSPDVGAQRILLHIQHPEEPSLWEKLTLGPGASFDYEVSGDVPPGQEIRATAYFDGTNDFASSVSETLKLVWQPAG